jgi:hypothetical protein
MKMNRKRKLLICLGMSLIVSSGLMAQNTLDRWLEAEANPAQPIKFANDEAASGGKITWGTRWYRLARVPLPESKQKYYVYIYAKTVDHKKQYFSLRSGSKTHVKVHLPTSNKWGWIKLGPIKNPGVPLYISPNGAAKINNYLDGFVVSARDKLSHEQLNKLKIMSSRQQEYIGQWLEAEEQPDTPIKFAKDNNASGGKITWGSRWYRLARVPMPTNKKDVYVYIYAKTDNNVDQYFHLSSRKKNYGKVKLPVAGKWCWAKLGPIKYNGLDISIRPNGKPGINSYLDGFVVSSKDMLSRKQLERLKNKQRRGQMAIGKCSKAPVIDGKLSDACWSQGVVVSPFLLNKASEFAKEQTQVYMTYDDNNIYVGFRCFANVLDPRQNRLHEFVDKVKERDSAVIFKDDCVVMLFSPDAKVCYELIVNANGAVSDAKCGKPDFWKTRDLKWNSGVEVKGSRQNGFWTLEMALPRNVLTRSDNSNSNFKFLVGRINQAARESSSFSRITRGFHDPESFCSLLFRKNVPSVGLGKFPAFNAGADQLQVNVGGGTKGFLSIEQLVCNSGGKPQLFVKKVSLYSKAVVGAPLKVAGGELKYRIVLRNAGNAQVLLETPDYRLDPVVSQVKVEIKAPGKYQFFVNGKMNNNQMNNGLNVFALKAVKGTSAKITIGSKVISLDSTWKFSASADKVWNKAGCDTSKWQNAPIKNGVLQQGGYARKIVYIDETRLWPNWSQRGVNICRGSTQQFFFPPRGLKGLKKVSGFKMNLELPMDFEFVGASSYYDLFKTSYAKIGTVVRNEVKYNKYQISLPKNTKYVEKLPRTHKYCAFVVRAPRNNSKSAVMYYYASADGGYIEEIPHKLKINLLPALHGKQPKKIIFQLWTSWLRRMSDLKLQGQIVEDCRLAGFTEIETLTGPTPGLKNFSTISFKRWSLNMAPLIEQYPDMAMINDKGAKISTMVCSTALLNNLVAGKYLENQIASWRETHKAMHVDWDYEADPFESQLSCYCPRCLKAFGKGSLSPMEIKKKYETEWMDFMTSRMADVAGQIGAGLHKVDPKIIFSVYSGYQSERTKRRYGVDWSKLNGKIQLAMCGYGRPEKYVKATLKAIGSTPILLGAIAHPTRNTNRAYPTECSAAKLIRRLLDSRGSGVLVYCLSGLDGRTFHAMSQVTSLAAEYEDFFIKGKRVDSTIKCNSEHAVLEWNKQKLLIVLNQTRKSRKFRANLKSGVGVFDFYADKKLAVTRYISGTIAPGKIKAYLIK